MKNMIRAAAGGILGMLASGVASATDLPFSDGFEGYGVGTVLDGTNGWGATDNTVVVQTNVAWRSVLGSNAVILLPSKVVSNQLVSLPATNVWSDLYLTNSVGMAAGSVSARAVNTNMTAQWFIETNGYPVVWNRTNSTGAGVWLVCSNDYWGTNTAVFNTNAWMRFTLCRNYNNGTNALFLNEHLLLHQLPFINASRVNSELFQMVGGLAVTSYFDEVSARYAPANFTADLDNDGVTDADEIQACGNVTTMRRLTITTSQTNLTDGGTGGGWLVAPSVNPFEVFWSNVSTGLYWSASNNYYVADLFTNGASVGNFAGRGSNYAEYAWTNTHADATVRVAFARMPVITASNSAYGTITPPLTNAYPGESRTFTLQATNSHYFIASVWTNGERLSSAAYSGLGTNSGTYEWPAITTNGGIEVLYAHKYTNSASVVTVGGQSGWVGGAIVASKDEVYPGETVTFTMTPNSAYGVMALTNNGALAASFDRIPVVTSHDITNVQSHLTAVGVFGYTARRRVPQDGYATIQDAMAAAITGETVVVSGGPYAGFVFSNGVDLVATNVAITGDLIVSSGTTGTLTGCSSLVAGSTTVNGLLVVSNGTVDVGMLTIAAGATVQVVNATSFTADGVTFRGAVALGTDWKSTRVSRTPPFSDGFEDYATNTALVNLGNFGWNASESGVIVQGVVYTQEEKAVQMPINSILSNSLAPTVASNIWVEWTYREAGRINESLVKVVEARTNMTLILFVNTNGYLAVYDGDAGAFRILSNDVCGVAVPTLATSDWPRLAVNMNYQTHKVAVLLNGRLVAQQLRFINVQQSNCGRLEWDAGTAGSTYLDDLKVWTNATSVASGDIDNDGISDAVEINQYGSILLWPRGSVFKVR